jgi:hypothetical protein
MLGTWSIKRGGTIKRKKKKNEEEDGAPSPQMPSSLLTHVCQKGKKAFRVDSGRRERFHVCPETHRRSTCFFFLSLKPLPTLSSKARFGSFIPWTVF